MKKNDIASLIIIVVVSFAIAYFVGNSIFNTPESRSTQIEEVNAFSAQITEPSDTVFTANSINLTEDITIDSSSTDKPFEE